MIKIKKKLMLYIINMILIINISFFLVEILHSFNNIDLVLILASSICFYSLFFVLSSVINNMYSNFVYKFFFKYQYFFVLIQKNIIKIWNVNLLKLCDTYNLLFVKKYSMYINNLNNFFFFELLKKNSLNYLYNFNFDLKKSILYSNKKKFYFFKNRYILHI